MLKFYKHITPLIFLSILFTLGFCAFVYPMEFVFIGKLSYLFTIGLAIAIIYKANFKIGDVASKTITQTIKEYFNLILWQLAFIFSFFALVVVFIGAGPENITQSLSLEKVFASLNDTFIANLSLTPFNIILFWGIICAHYFYNKNGAPHVYSVLANFNKNKKSLPINLQLIIKNFAISVNFWANMLIIAAITSLCILLLTYTFELYIGFSHLILPFVTILSLYIIAPFLMFKKTKNRIAKLTKRYNLTTIFKFFILIMCLVMLIASLLNSIVASSYPEIIAQTNCKSCGKYFSQIEPEFRFSGLFFAWGLIWVPFLGLKLAKFANGKTVLQTAIGFLSLPVLIYLSLKFIGVNFILNILSIANILPLPIIFIALALVLWNILKPMLNNCQGTDFLISGEYANLPNLPRNRTELAKFPKNYGIGKYLPMLLMSSILLIFMHTVGGWYLVQIQLATIGQAVLFSSIFALTAFLIKIKFK